jgi:hypothetical protein
MVHALRTYASLAIDTRALATKNFAYVLAHPEVIRSKVNTLTGEGLDAAKTINAYPRILANSSETVIGRIRYIRRLARVLAWPGNVEGLLETYPSVVMTPPNKLSFLAHIAAEHFDPQQAVTYADILSAVIAPAESHLAAVALDAAYHPHRAQYYRARIPPSGRHPEALELLRRPETRTKIGEKVARAYIRYDRSRPR